MERYVIHPTKRELRQFLENTLDTDKRAAVEHHVGNCEFCAEYLENERHFSELSAQADFQQTDSTEQEQIGGLFQNAIAGLSMAMRPMEVEAPRPLRLLAADGKTEAAPSVECLCTFYSDTPELVMRVMRENPAGKDYLQLVGDELALISNVLVRLPGHGKDVLTDARGRAELSHLGIEGYSSLKWEIKLPDAVFSLEPLDYDPEKTIHSEEFMLSTDSDSTIKVTFDDKTEGKQISIEILALDGQSDFENVRLFVSQGDSIQPASAELGKKMLFPLADNTTRVEIRIFQ